MPESKPSEVWSAGPSYEAYIGRWSRPIAEVFVDWLGVPARAAWLDVGCGTGALSATVLERAAPARLVGVDAAEGFLGFARDRIPDPRATFLQGDARSLPVESSSFDAAISGLVLNFVPEPARMLAEMARAVRPGGIVAVYVWDYADGMELIRRFWDAAVALDPEAAALDEARRFPVCSPKPLAALFAAAGLVAAEGRAIEIATPFASFDELWAPFLGGQGPAPAYVTGLSEPRRRALRDRLRAMLPAAPDGRVQLRARAFARRAGVAA